VITLVQPPPLHGIPSVSPFGTKVETYLRMVGLAYRTRSDDPRRSPKGKVPWIEEDGRVVSDSSDILDDLKARHGDPLDAGLSAQQRAIGLVARRTLEEHFYWAVVYARWAEDEGFVHTQAYFRQILPPVIGPVLLRTVLRRHMLRSLHAHGLGRHDRADIYRRAGEDLAAVAALLGDRPFLLGERPTSFDACVFAFTSAVLRHPFDGELKRRVAAHANLVDHDRRMYDRCFGDHPPGRSKDAP
jgi:glutathione S-transferase